MKILWVVLAGLLILIWLFFPTIFNWWALNIWHVPTEQINEIGKLGPLGDIYGSLNTLISSIALCAVAFSTWLQVTSLKEARETNERQLKLAKEAHDAQIKESQSAIFTTKFYGLLNFKNEKFHQLAIVANNGVHHSAYDIMSGFASHFVTRLENEWSDVEFLSSKDLKDEYIKFLDNYDKAIVQIFSYYLIYGDIIQLIKNSEIPDKDKEFFRSVLSNSMAGQEQIVILWLGAFYNEIRFYLDGSELLTQFFDEKYIPFAKKFHRASHFKPQVWKDIFEEQIKKTPA